MGNSRPDILCVPISNAHSPTCCRCRSTSRGRGSRRANFCWLCNVRYDSSGTTRTCVTLERRALQCLLLYSLREVPRLRFPNQPLTVKTMPCGISCSLPLNSGGRLLICLQPPMSPPSEKDGAPYPSEVKYLTQPLGKCLPGLYCYILD